MAQRVAQVAADRVYDGRCARVVAPSVGTLAMQDEIVVDASQVLHAVGHLEQHVAVLELHVDELRREEVAADGAQQLRDVAESLVLLVLHPRHDGHVHLRLAPDVQLVSLYHLDELHRRQVHELVVATHARKVLVDVLARLVVERVASVRLREVRDPDAVRRIELVLKERAARLDDVYDLEHGRRRQQRAHVHLAHVDLGRVREVDERSEDARRNSLQRDLDHLRLAHPARTEHRLEVGTRSRQHQLVRGKRPRLGPQ